MTIGIIISTIILVLALFIRDELLRSDIEKLKQKISNLEKRIR